MNKPEIVTAYASKYNMTKVDAVQEIENFIGFVIDYLEVGETLNFPGFMRFGVKEIPARTARNPKTGETIQVPSKKKVVITPMKTVKDAVNR